MPAPEKWAHVANGAITHGPGPLPYYWTDPETGDPVELYAVSLERRAELGWQLVEIRNWREIDEEIETRNVPTVTLENGKPVETHSYSLTPGARQAMLRRVDEQAEERRKAYITSYPGQVMEYDEAYRQAVEVLALPEDAPIAEGDFPFLDADVGVTDNPATGEKVETIREAAQVIKFMHDQMFQAGMAIRAARLAAKAAIRDAATDAEAYAIYTSLVWPA